MREMGKTFTARDETGQELEGELLTSFYLQDTDKDYVVYTFNEKDSKGLIVMYVSTVTDNGLQSVETDEEWDQVKLKIKEIIG